MAKKKSIDTTAKRITFHNKISPSYRALHVDGAFGGLTPKGYISLSFFAERFPIPKSTEFTIGSEGYIGNKVKDSEDSKSGILREYEFGIYMDLTTSQALVELLQSKIRDLEKMQKNNEHESSIGQ